MRVKILFIEQVPCKLNLTQEKETDRHFVRQNGTYTTTVF